MASSPLSDVSPGRVAVALMAATGLSTLLPWTTGDGGSVIGVRHDDAFLVIAASVIGIALQRKAIRPAWIAPGFAAVVQFRDISQVMDADAGVGIGLWVGLVASVAAMALLIADLLITIRAGAPAEDASGA